MNNMNKITNPDESSISTVTERCNCDRDKAIELLSKSNNDPERAIRFYSVMSRYRGRASPRSTQGNTPTTPRSEAGRPPSWNGDSSLDDKFRLSPDSWRRKPSMHSIGSSGFEHGGDVRSPEPHNESHHSLLPPLSQSGDVDAVGERLGGEPVGSTADSMPHANDAGASLKDPVDNSQILSPEGADEPEVLWYFTLPVIPREVSSPQLDSIQDYDTFDLHKLLGEVQYGASLASIQNYLVRFDRAKVKELINNDVEGVPAMFYIVETNKEDILTTWVAYGGDPTVKHRKYQVPLLAFAIMHSETMQADTAPMTATLLSLGASPDVIPSAFYSPYDKDLPETGLSDGSLKDVGDEDKKWCKGAARLKLARTATLSQRYYLDRAAKTKKPSVRQIQVAQKRNAEPLLGITNFLIGQTMAAKTLLDKLLSHLTVPGKKPLVLTFAGPSGHGKTELARCLGKLLSLELEVVDCTIFNREPELFGSRPPYAGWDKGSRLNNFLANNNGKRCIVFLDEFEKTNSDIHKTLLLPFDNGEYQDRRDQAKINCSKTIWILATNAHDPIIQNFSATNKQALFADEDETEKERLLKQLAKRIKQDFLAHHGSPITGRISAFVPFLPFSSGEQAVIIHKHLLELGRNVRTPINLQEGEGEQLIGNVRMRIRRDASVCRLLAQSEYHTDLGARSLISAVDTIKTMMVEAYLSVDEEITENAGMSEFIIDAVNGEVVINIAAPKAR